MSKLYNLCPSGSTHSRKVKELYRGSTSPGLNLIQWDGRNDSGQRVSSGVYTIRIEGGGINQSKRVVVVR